MRKEQEELGKYTHTHVKNERGREREAAQNKSNWTIVLCVQTDIPEKRKKEEEFLSRERIAYSRHRIKGLSLLIVLLDACAYVYAMCCDA